MSLGLEDATVVRPANQSVSSLATCPDCKRLISHRAELCPGCGLRLQPYPMQQPTVGRIAGGILLGYLGIMVINGVLAFFAFLLFAGSLAAAMQGIKK